MNNLNICKYINTLIEYGIKKNLCTKNDKVYIRNQLLHLLKEDNWQDIDEKIEFDSISEILDELCTIAVQKGLIEDSIKNRDAFDSLLMNVLMPRPSEVIRSFYDRYEQSPKEATDAYYKMALDSHYIREERIRKNIQYKVDTEYGKMDITINLSKPEKDPKDIAAALVTASDSIYPACAICKESEGYYGNVKWDGRSNHRLIPLKLGNNDWYLQYSPYVYYNEHCIVLNSEHTPMKINHQTFENLFAFVKQFPHYFIGSNADLPIVGGSILTHDHYQGGRYTFAMTEAETVKTYDCFSYLGVKVERLKWPLTVFRLSCQDSMPLIKAADQMLNAWRNYSDESVDVLAKTDVLHNTITPIARYRNQRFELDLVLRNNRTSEEFPLGIFHPHSEIHHIKKENIGLIEVMGLAVLPARLKNELKDVVAYLTHEKNDLTGIESHEEWICKLQEEHDWTKEDVKEVVGKEVANIFVQGLEHCGVFKWDALGQAAADRFIQKIKEEK